MNLRKLLSVILTVSLVFGLVSTALADSYTPSGAFDAAQRMADLGLVKGRAPGDFALSETITRAEMVTILIRALGQEQTAQLMMGAPAFSDSGSHWASGYIAVAKNLGVTDGRTPTTFEPDAPVTAAEAVAFLVKFLGLPVNDSLGWPNSYLAAALEAGFVTTDDDIANLANSPAPRGMVFFFGDKAFSNVKMENGKTVYQTYVDTDPPMITVDAVAAVTSATSVTITGKVSGHTVLHVGHSSADWATVATSADGSFSASVNLNPGENNILVHALDKVGNEALKTVTVTRELGAAASIEAPAITVAAGGEVEVAAMVKDANGAVIEGAAVTGESSVGTYADGKFTAGTKAGTGTLTLRSGDAVAEVAVTVTPGAMAKVTADKTSAAPGEKVTLTATDEYGNAISGATFSVDSADAVVVGGTFVGTKAGTYTVTATLGDATATTTVGVYSNTVAKAAVSALATAVGNNATEYEISVSAVDEGGNVVGSFNGSGKTFTFTAVAGVTATAVDSTAKSGVQKWKVKFDETLAGTEVKLEFAVTGEDTKKGSTMVEVLPQVASAIKVVSADKYITANDGGEEAEITVQVVDQVGKPMVTGNYELTATVSGVARLWDGDNKTEITVVTDPAEDSQAVIPVRSLKGQTGDVTVTVTAEGLESATASLKAAVALTAKAVQVEANKETAGVEDDVDTAASKIVTYTVRLVDANGVPIRPAEGADPIPVTMDVDTDDYDMIFAGDPLTALSAKTNNPVGELDYDNPKLTVAVVSSLAKTINFTFKVTDMTSASVATTFTPGTATKVTLSKGTDLPVLVAASSPEAEFTAQLRDEFNNKVAKAGVELTIEAFKGVEDETTSEVKVNGKEKTNKVTTGADGSATFKVTTLPYVDEEYRVEVSGTDLTAGEGTLLVQNTVPSSVTVALVVSGGELSPVNREAGTEVDIRATVKDGFGRTLTEDEVAVGYLKLYINDKEVDAEDWPFVYDDANGWYVVEGYELTKAGTNTIKVAVSAAAGTVEGSRNVSIRADTTTTSYTVTQADVEKEHFDGDGDRNTATIAKDTVTSLTIRATDGFGNVKTLSQSRKLTVTVQKLNDTEDGWVPLEADDVFEVRTSSSGTDKLNVDDAFSITSSTSMHVIASAGTYLVTITDNATPANTGSFVIVSE